MFLMATTMFFCKSLWIRTTCKCLLKVSDFPQVQQPLRWLSYNIIQTINAHTHTTTLWVFFKCHSSFSVTVCLSSEQDESNSVEKFRTSDEPSRNDIFLYFLSTAHTLFITGTDLVWSVWLRKSLSILLFEGFFLSLEKQIEGELHMPPCGELQ